MGAVAILLVMTSVSTASAPILPRRDLATAGGVAVGAAYGRDFFTREPLTPRPSWSPALGGEGEWGGPAVRAWVGADIAPLFEYTMTDAIKSHGITLSGGPVFGGDVLRGGPFFEAGLPYALGPGARVVLQPWHTGAGFEVRAAWIDGYVLESLILLRWSYGARPDRKP